MEDGEHSSDAELLLAARTRSEAFGVFSERHFDRKAQMLARAGRAQASGTWCSSRSWAPTARRVVGLIDRGMFGCFVSSWPPSA
jgi:hypothetical protein